MCPSIPSNYIFEDGGYFINDNFEDCHYNVDHFKSGCYYIDGNASGCFFNVDTFETRCYFTDGYKEDGFFNVGQGVETQPEENLEAELDRHQEPLGKAGVLEDIDVDLLQNPLSVLLPISH